MRTSRVQFPLWQPVPHWLGWCQYNVTGCDWSHGLPTLFCVREHIQLSDVSLGTCPRYNLVVDDVKKLNKPNQIISVSLCLSLSLSVSLSLSLSISVSLYLSVIQSYTLSLSASLSVSICNHHVRPFIVFPYILY